MTPDGSQGSAVADGTATRRRWLAAVAAVAVGLAILVAVQVSDGAAPDDEAVPPADDGAAPDEDAEPPDGPLTSAALGPDGTRSLDEVPDELPAGLLTADARDVAGTVARGGDDWSAAVVYGTDVPRSDAEAAIETALVADAFTRREAITDADRRVIVYDGADGSIATVTLQGPEAGPLTVGIVRVGP